MRQVKGDLRYYLSQIQKLQFVPVSKEIFHVIQNEGLDEETGSASMTNWVYAELKVTPVDKAGLRNMSRDALEKFNQFDIYLKTRYKRLIDLIDYRSGTVIIVLIKKMCDTGLNLRFTGTSQKKPSVQALS
jgi:hypothetical protein